MKKVIYIVLLVTFFFPLSTFSQKKYDVRKVDWGMTMQEVISSEYPLQPKKESNRLEFENVVLGNGFSANLIYDFKNQTLTSLKYIIYLTDKEASTATKISLSGKVFMTKWIIDIFKNKDYKCISGWHSNSISPKEIINKFGKLSNCNIDEEFLNRFSELAKQKNSIYPTISFENKRSYANFRYNECQNSESYHPTPNWLKEGRIFTLEDVFLWLEVKPSSKLEKKNRESRF